MKTIMHYHKDTGRISAWGSADADESYLPDHLIIKLEADTSIAVDPQKQMIKDGELVDIPESELAEWNAPTEGEREAMLEAEAMRMLIGETVQRMRDKP